MTIEKDVENKLGQRLLKRIPNKGRLIGKHSCKIQFGVSISFSSPVVIVSICFILLLNPGIAIPGSAKLSVLIATGMPGDTSYILGQAMASLWSDKLRQDGITVSAAVSEGSCENIEALRIDDADLIIADEPLCRFAFSGEGMFRSRSVKELRSMAPLWNEALHIVIREDLVKTNTLKDLEGLTIATSLPESGGRLMVQRVLRLSSQVDGAKVKLRFMSNTRAAHAISRGKVQGLALVGSAPITVIRALNNNDKLRLRFICLTGNLVDEMTSNGDIRLFQMTIPPSMYKGMRGPVETIGVRKLLAVKSSLDRQVVYKLTRALFEGLDDLVKAHPAARELQALTDLDNMNIPLHYGAYDYYKEMKLKVPKEAFPKQGPGPVSPFKTLEKFH